MAIVNATLEVNFIADQAGDHRVCWSITGPGGPFDCSTIVNCVGGGNPCQALIPIQVNTTSCDGTITFDGYIQATCEDVTSPNGRLLFSQTYVPNPVCVRHEALCAWGGIIGFNIITAGQDYQLTDTVNIIRDGADPYTADGSIQIGSIGDGVINSISSLLSAGTLYTALDVLNVVDGGGAGTGATIRVDTVGGGGDILTYTLLTNGSDYVGPFTFTGGTGSGADFDIVNGVDYDIVGSILTLNIITNGEYGVIPTITISSATGHGASIEVRIADCPQFANIGEDCDNPGNQVDIPTIPVGELFATCLVGGANPGPDEWVVTETGCCIPADTTGDPCFDYHLTNTSGGPVLVQYTACGGVNSTVNVADSTSVTICAILDGVIDPQLGATFTVVNTGTPCT